MKKIREGHEKATSENIPKVDFDMIHRFYSTHPDYFSVESRGVKSARSMRAEYALEAVGYVELKQEGLIVTVYASVTPEHSIRITPYTVQVIVDESKQGKICKCHDCSASEGGCKHGLALVSWLWKKSSEPSVTSVECYWKMSPLSAAAKYREVASAHTLGKGQADIPVVVTRQGFRKEFEEKQGMSSVSLQATPREPLSLHHLAVLFQKTGVQHTPGDFMNFIRNTVSCQEYVSAQYRTSQHSASSVWHELRYGRITASILSEAAHCHTHDGSLMETIMGATSLFETQAIRRGKDLEGEVLKKVLGKHERPGIYISEDLPFLGASPDAICGEFVIEVKCPSKLSTISHFLDNNRPTPKCMAQLMLQMKLTGRRKSKFCVASPTFESDGLVTVVEVKYNMELTEDFISKAKDFWQRAIFTKLFTMLQ